MTSSCPYYFLDNTLWCDNVFQNLCKYSSSCSFLNDLIIEFYRRSGELQSENFISSYWNVQITSKLRCISSIEYKESNLLYYYLNNNKLVDIDPFIIKLKEETLNTVKKQRNSQTILKDSIPLTNSDLMNNNKNNNRNIFLQEFIKHGGLHVCAGLLLGPFYHSPWEFLLRFIVNTLNYSLLYPENIPNNTDIADIFQLQNAKLSKNYTNGFLNVLWYQLQSISIPSTVFRLNVAILWKSIIGFHEITNIINIFNEYLCEVLLKPLAKESKQSKDLINKYVIPSQLNTLMDIYNVPKDIFSSTLQTKEHFLINWFILSYKHIINTLTQNQNKEKMDIIIEYFYNLLELIISITSQSITGRFLSWFLYFWCVPGEKRIPFYWLHHFFKNIKLFPSHTHRRIYASLFTIQSNCLKFLKVKQTLSSTQIIKDTPNQQDYYHAIGVDKCFPNKRYLIDLLNKNLYLPQITLQCLSVNDYILKLFILTKINLSTSIWRDISSSYETTLKSITSKISSSKNCNQYLHRGTNLYQFTLNNVTDLYFVSNKSKNNNTPSDFLYIIQYNEDNKEISNILPAKFCRYSKQKNSDTITVYCHIDTESSDTLQNFNTVYVCNPALIASYYIHEAIHRLLKQSVKETIFPSWFGKILSGKSSPNTLFRLAQVPSESKKYFDNPESIFILNENITINNLNSFFDNLSMLSKIPIEKQPSTHTNSTSCIECSLLLDEEYDTNSEEIIDLEESKMKYNIQFKCKNIINSKAGNGRSNIHFISQKQIPLYDSQQQVILSALLNRITLIVGPPGTGKTTVTSQIIQTLFKNYFMEYPSNLERKKILVLAQSNNAIDQIIERINMNSVPVLRLGSQTSSKLGKAMTYKGHIKSLSDQSKNIVNRLLLNTTEDSKLNILSDQINQSISISRKKATYNESYSILKEYINNTFTKSIKKLNKHSYDENILKETMYSLGIKYKIKEDPKIILTMISNQLKRLEEYLRILSLGSYQDKKKAIFNLVGVVAATCSGYSMKLDEFSSYEFETIIIEEAGKVLESECIYAFSKSLKRLILVGDDQQMRSLLFHDKLKTHSFFDQSLMVRLQRLGVPTIQLNQQTRANPFIANLYRWRYTLLLDHERSISHIPPIHQLLCSVLTLNIIPRNNEKEYNSIECNTILEFISILIDFGIDINHITILTPYRKQQLHISSKCEDTNLSEISVCTVDEYQGKENDIILLSMSFSGNHPSPFLCDERRINVMTSRARKLFVLFGNLSALQRSQSWMKVFNSITETQNQECSLRKTKQPSTKYIEYLDNSKTWNKLRPLYDNNSQNK